MQFIDTHLHLQDYKQKFATEIIGSALSCGVNPLVCVTVYEENWQDLSRLALQYPHNIIPCFAIHPWYADTAQSGWTERLAQMLQTFPHALIGESGLDFLHDNRVEPQLSIFRRQAELSCLYHRPLIIHAVKAQAQLEQLWSILPPKFVLHSYLGKNELVKQAVKHGGYISVSPSVLRYSGAASLLRAIPFSRLLLETDGPFHGDENISSSYIPSLAAYVADQLELSVAEVASQTYHNSLEFIQTW